MCVGESMGGGSEEEKVYGGEGRRGMEDRKDFFKALWGPTFAHPKNKGN